MRGSFKANPWFIIRAHHRTYVDAATNRPRWQDYVAFDLSPLIVAGASIALHLKLSVGASAGLLSASALLSALLFGVMLQVAERAMDWADDPPEPGVETAEHVRFLRELGANAGYAALTCIVAAGAFVVAATTAHRKLEIATAVGLALGWHLALVLMMVIKRVFALTENRLNRVQTGAGRTVVPHRRQAPGSRPR
jgi:hypothetical protein